MSNRVKENEERERETEESLEQAGVTFRKLSRRKSKPTPAPPLVSFLWKLSTFVQRHSLISWKPFPYSITDFLFARSVSSFRRLVRGFVGYSWRKRAEGEYRGKSTTTREEKKERNTHTHTHKRKTERGEKTRSSWRKTKQKEQKEADESFEAVVPRSWPRKSVASSSSWTGCLSLIKISRNPPVSRKFAVAFPLSHARFASLLPPVARRFVGQNS